MDAAPVFDGNIEVDILSGSSCSCQWIRRGAC